MRSLFRCGSLRNTLHGCRGRREEAELAERASEFMVEFECLNVIFSSAGGDDARFDAVAQNEK